MNPRKNTEVHVKGWSHEFYMKRRCIIDRADIVCRKVGEEERERSNIDGYRERDVGEWYKYSRAGG